MLTLQDTLHTIDGWLKPKLFRDYCPNGLQVEGEKKQIQRIACGVTASQYVIDKAIEKQADMLLVHHGFFWKGESPVLSGSKKARIQSLLDNGIHLLAYHLPLDAHPQLGNNAQLANKLGLVCERRVPDQPDSLLCIGSLTEPMTGANFCERIEKSLERKPLYIGDSSQTLRHVAWCTGGAQSFFQQAIDQQVDAFITGEISEQNYHQAIESGVSFIAAGHHATERYGIQALAEKLAQEYQVDYFFIDQNNPV